MKGGGREESKPFQNEIRPARFEFLSQVEVGVLTSPRTEFQTELDTGTRVLKWTSPSQTRTSRNPNLDYNSINVN